MPRPLLVPFLVLASLGCQTTPNPSFQVTAAEATSALTEMRDPKPLDRPLVILGGYLDLGLGPIAVRDRIERAVGGDERILRVTTFTCADFDACRAKIVAAVDHAFPTDDPDATTEVDVIGLSMGGLAARHAAAPDPAGGRRLRIARLFTISSPHRGAYLAGLPTLHTLQRQMRSNSPFLAELNGPAWVRADYEVIPYVRLDDGAVGETRAAPPGCVPWWVPNQPLQDAHAFAAIDPRILADITRRLRGEQPFTRDPPAPLPGTEPAATAALQAALHTPS